MKSSFEEIGQINANLLKLRTDLEQLTLMAKIGKLKYMELFKFKQELEAYTDSLVDMNEKESSQ